MKSSFFSLMENNRLVGYHLLVDCMTFAIRHAAGCMELALCFHCSISSSGKQNGAVEYELLFALDTESSDPLPPLFPGYPPPPHLPSPPVLHPVFSCIRLKSLIWLLLEQSTCAVGVLQCKLNHGAGLIKYHLLLNATKHSLIRSH